MIDLAKIDDDIKYLDVERKKKFGGEWWLTALVLALYILGSVLLLVGAALQAAATSEIGCLLNRNSRDTKPNGRRARQHTTPYGLVVLGQMKGRL